MCELCETARLASFSVWPSLFEFLDCETTSHFMLQKLGETSCYRNLLTRPRLIPQKLMILQKIETARRSESLKKGDCMTHEIWLKVFETLSFSPFTTPIRFYLGGCLHVAPVREQYKRPGLFESKFKSAVICRPLLLRQSPELMVVVEQHVMTLTWQNAFTVAFVRKHVLWMLLWR